MLHTQAGSGEDVLHTQTGSGEDVLHTQTGSGEDVLHTQTGSGEILTSCLAKYKLYSTQTSRYPSNCKH